jgi:hypothetical protein
VLPHGGGRPGGVLGVNGLGDEPVALEGLPGPVRLGQGLDARLPDQVADLAHQPLQQRRVTGRGHGRMEQLVALQASTAGLDVGGHHLHGRLDPGEVLRRPSYGGQGGQLALQCLPCLDDVGEPLRVPVQGVHHLGRAGRVHDHGTVAVPHRDDADDLHRHQRLAHGRPADAQSAGELALGGKPVADV